LRAVGIRKFGGPEALEVLAIEPKAAKAGQVRVAVAFASVDPVDVHVRRGAYLGSAARVPEWPLVLGYEGAGTVESIGPEVTDIAVGDRVAWCGVAGAQAELATIPAWRLARVPERMPLDVACALQLDGLLAHALTTSVFPIGRGDTILIQAGGDAAGLLTTQLAKSRGATVIVTVPRTTDAGGPRAAGADLVLALEDGDVSDRIREATGAQGCHAVFDAGGRETFPASLANCRRRGVIALLASRTGPTGAIWPEDLAAAGSVYVTRVHLGDYLRDAAETRWRARELMDGWLAGQLEARIGRIFPLAAAREGHIAIESGMATGKILIQI
jgi:NADPH2:quinone reductase